MRLAELLLKSFCGYVCRIVNIVNPVVVQPPQRVLGQTRPTTTGSSFIADPVSLVTSADKALEKYDGPEPDRASGQIVMNKL